MAYEENLLKINLPANADLSAAGQYRFVTVNSSGRVALTGNNAEADGILQDKPDAAGVAGCVAVAGVSKLVLGGTVTAGDDLASDANGDGTLAGTGDVVNARALKSGVDNDIIPVLLKSSGHNALA